MIIVVVVYGYYYILIYIIVGTPGPAPLAVARVLCVFLICFCSHCRKTIRAQFGTFVVVDLLAHGIDQNKL